jgi:hypothetical protein
VGSFNNRRQIHNRLVVMVPFGIKESSIDS